MARKDARSAMAHGSVWKKRGKWLLAATAVVGFALVVRQGWGPEQASAQQNAAAKSKKGDAAVPVERATVPTASSEKLQIMAVVNSKEITRQMVSQACIERFGKEVLESLINKHLISHHCAKNNIVITREEVDAEIEKMAAKFNLGREQWLAMLQKERGVLPEQYARDIIWPTLALRKLAKNRLAVSEEELQRAYESEFGEAVQARLIALEDVEVAKQIIVQLKTQPQEFSRLARDYSTDVNSASAGGMLPPIRRFVGDPQVEKVVFSLKPGEVSPVIRVGEQYAIFKCEGRLPARNVEMAQVKERLEDKIREGKLRGVAGEIFQNLQKEAVVQNVLNNPALSKQLPGVAATVNGHRVTLAQLGEECIARYAEGVLETEINRELLEQALKRKGIEVTKADLDMEIAHAAVLAGVTDKEGRADMQRWVETVTREQQVSYDIYIRDAVWPSAALKKLVTSSVKVTEDDLKKGFEANYGKRVRCRAIVMANLRRAQEVWDKARQNPTLDYFGDLAEEYSVEASSRALRGEVPPIKMHGGQAVLEKEAFRLKQGEISGVIQIGDKFVILMCEGYTAPEKIALADVRDHIERDLFEKKVRLAMNERFEAIKSEASIDNYLAGTSQTPKSADQAKSGVRTATHVNTAPRSGSATAKGNPATMKR